MFSQPVVFVVGAGASNEFGLPVSGQLNASIALSLNFNRGPNGLLIGERAVFDLLGSKFGLESGKYQDAATELATHVMEFASIDETLHWFSTRPQIVLLGKFAIVREILKAERRSILFSTSDSAAEITKKDVWLPGFLSLVIGSQTREQAIEGMFNNVSIVDFNYDRTIEHALLSRLQMNFGLDADEAKKAISSLKVFRPYGSVGPLPWQNQSGVAFGAELDTDHDRLFALTTNILTYTEQNVSQTIRSEIRSAIDHARLVVFLGFGFHPQNMALLQATSAVPWRRAIATALKINSKNFEALTLKIAMTVGGNRTENIQLLEWYSHQIFEWLKPSLLAGL
jgi:hypothetical protein